MRAGLVDLVVGVFVEVPWDVERTNVDGRRKGERVVKSLCWKGEVLEVKHEDGRTTAKIRNEALCGFQSQVGKVHVFPKHMLSTDESDITHLCWRYYESSGNVNYNCEASNEERDHDTQDTVLCSQDDSKQFRDQLEKVKAWVEHVERFMAQQELLSGAFRNENTSESCSQRLFALLRHKVATIVQKPLLVYKQRNENIDTGGTLFDFSCAGSLRASVDCTIEEFEFVCRAVSSVVPSAHSRVDGNRFLPCSHSLPASITRAEIMFASLQRLCEGIGINELRDMMSIAIRERTPNKGCTKDAAIRIVGTFLVDNDSEDTPPAIPVCRGLHEEIQPHEEYDILTRDNRELDPKTVHLVDIFSEISIFFAAL